MGQFFWTIFQALLTLKSKDLSSYFFSNLMIFYIYSYLVNAASADVDSKSQYDETPIFLASQNGNLLIFGAFFRHDVW